MSSRQTARTGPPQWKVRRQKNRVHSTSRGGRLVCPDALPLPPIKPSSDNVEMHDPHRFLNTAYNRRGAPFIISHSTRRCFSSLSRKPSGEINQMDFTEG